MLSTGIDLTLSSSGSVEVSLVLGAAAAGVLAADEGFLETGMLAVRASGLLLTVAGRGGDEALDASGVFSASEVGAAVAVLGAVLDGAAGRGASGALDATGEAGAGLDGIAAAVAGARDEEVRPSVVPAGGLESRSGDPGGRPLAELVRGRVGPSGGFEEARPGAELRESREEPNRGLAAGRVRVDSSGVTGLAEAAGAGAELREGAGPGFDAAASAGVASGREAAGGAVSAGFCGAALDACAAGTTGLSRDAAAPSSVLSSSSASQSSSISWVSFVGWMLTGAGKESLLDCEVAGRESGGATTWPPTCGAAGAGTDVLAASPSACGTVGAATPAGAAFCVGRFLGGALLRRPPPDRLPLSLLLRLEAIVIEPLAGGVAYPAGELHTNGADVDFSHGYTIPAETQHGSRKTRVQQWGADLRQISGASRRVLAPVSYAVRRDVAVREGWPKQDMPARLLGHDPNHGISRACPASGRLTFGAEVLSNRQARLVLPRIERVLELCESRAMLLPLSLGPRSHG